MTDRQVAIVDTGVANIASLEAAFRRHDTDPELTCDPATVADVDYLVLPGVGAFGAGMEMLRENDLVDPVFERIEADRPTLAVCLGLQFLATDSEETADIAGLDLVDVSVERFPPDVRTPQFGWNRVEAAADCRMLTDGYAYFANSYRIADPPDGWAVARSDYGGSFIAAIERGPILACQFHPEISGEWGHHLLARWLNY
ncbi:MAG: imidazole glycerol phosphate synthase subunit HisH [Bradymonadaceae bacterium]